MFYLLTGITALLGLLVIGGAFITRGVWIKLCAVLVGIACLSYAVYLLFFLEEYVMITFPIFALIIPIIILVIEFIFRKKKSHAKHSVKNTTVPIKNKKAKVKAKIETRSTPLVISEPQPLVSTPISHGTLPKPIQDSTQENMSVVSKDNNTEVELLKLPPKPPVSENTRSVATEDVMEEQLILPPAIKPPVKTPVKPLLPARSKEVMRELNESEQAEKDKFNFPF